MTIDTRIKCAVCAWRENCTKKHIIKESAMHCPDYVRDQKLGPEEDLPEEGEGASNPLNHSGKKIEDPFA